MMTIRAATTTLTAALLLLATLTSSYSSPDLRPEKKCACKDCKCHALKNCGCSDTNKPKPKDITGYYKCKGTSPGKPYTGIVTIEGDGKGQVYKATWTMGGASFVGVGIRQGNTISFGWAAGGEPPPRGVNIYAIEGNTLSGVWASIPGDGIVFNETLTFLDKLEKSE